MYRDWREVTKILLSTKGPMTPAALPKSKMERTETKLYVKWVIKEIRKDRASFNGYAKGKGIIATREKFLRLLKEKGADALEFSNEVDKTDVATDEPRKTIIVPVAIPGCGAFSLFHFILFTFLI